MAVRIRKNGRIFCAALSNEEDRDCYIDDVLHHLLCAKRKILVTTYNDEHMKTGGEWWWKGQEPHNVVIDEIYYTQFKLKI